MLRRTLGVFVALVALLAALPPPALAVDLGGPVIAVMELDSVAAAELPALNALQDTVGTPAVSWTSDSYSTAAAMPSTSSLAAPEVAACRLCTRAEARVVVGRFYDEGEDVPGLHGIGRGGGT